MIKNKNDNNTSKFSLSSLLHNNRFLMIISVIIGFGLWTWVAIEKSPEVERVITDVPVQINLENSVPEQLGLQIFGESEFAVDITVKGKKYVISSLSSEDFDVVANTNYVDSSGLKSLQLKVTPKESDVEFTIASYSSNYVEVFFDVYKEIEMAIIPEIKTDLKSTVSPDCLMGDLVFSSNTVLVSGPATEINRISSVTANVVLDKVLDKTTTFEPVINIVTNDGSKLEYSSISEDAGKITMTIPVLKEVELPTVIEFRNAPSYFINNPLKYSISPAKVKVALPVNLIETTKYFVVDTIDFADLSGSHNTFNVDADKINSYKIMDSRIHNFTVKIDAGDMTSRTLTVPAENITVKNSRDDFNIKVLSTKDIAVKLVGTQSAVDSVKAEDITLVIDTAEQTISADTTSLKAYATVAGDNACWVTGRYEIKVSAVPTT